MPATHHEECDTDAAGNELRWYKLLVGQHQQKEDNPDGTKDKEGNVLQVPMTYHAGSEFQSKTDLVERFGADKFAYADMVPQPRKRARRAGEGGSASDSTHPTHTDANRPDGVRVGEDDAGKKGTRSEDEKTRKGNERSVDEQYGKLEDKNVSDLKELAAMLEIDLKGATHKADIIKVIRDAS